ncbi:hypothetical protein FHE66_06360, partial [Georgenia sp. 311]|uniref:hypothetical protein n=1 Tax=Georgenia sp. 311 TaxID=2585134 RepID=UPI001111FCAC
MTVERPTAVVLLLALLLGGALVLRPSGTTLAAWSDEVVVTVPALRTGGVRVDVAPSGSTSATIAMSGDVHGTWQPSAVRVGVDGRALTGSDLAGSTIEYRLATAGGTCPNGGAPAFTASPSGAGTSFTVTGQQITGARTLCLTFVPSDKVRAELGGRALSFATSVTGLAAGSSAWTASTAWSATQQLPAAPRVTGPTCSRGFLNQFVTLSWEWDRAGLAQNAARFSLQVDDRGTWREVGTASVSSRPSATLSPYQFDVVTFDTYSVRVVAVLADGTTIPSSTTVRVRVERVG